MIWNHATHPTSPQAMVQSLQGKIENGKNKTNLLASLFLYTSLYPDSVASAITSVNVKVESKIKVFKSVPKTFRQAFHWGTGDYGTISTATMEHFYQLTN